MEMTVEEFMESPEPPVVVGTLVGMIDDLRTIVSELDTELRNALAEIAHLRSEVNALRRESANPYAPVTPIEPYTLPRQPWRGKQPGQWYSGVNDNSIRWDTRTDSGAASSTLIRDTVNRFVVNSKLSADAYVAEILEANTG